MRDLGQVFSCTLVSAAILAGPAFADTTSKPSIGVPTGAIIEGVVFDRVPMFEQGIVLDRIGVKLGDVLTTSSIERIGRQLKTLRVQHGFSYLAGTKPGRIVLSISAGC